MNRSHYHIITDKIIKSIFIFTLYTNFINCATNSDDINTQINTTLANDPGFSYDSQSLFFGDETKYSYEDSSETSCNSNEEFNEESKKYDDHQSSNSSIMEHSDIHSNGLQSTECTQSTRCPPQISNTFIVFSYYENPNAISSDHAYSKNQDEDTENPRSQTVQTIDDPTNEVYRSNLLAVEINALILGVETFIDLKKLSYPLNSKSPQYIHYFSKLYCNMESIHIFLKYECSAELNINKGIHKLKFKECSFNALAKLKLEFMKGVNYYENLAVKHNFGVLWHLFKFHPKIAFIITEYLTCAITNNDIETFKNRLDTYLFENRLTYYYADDPDKMDIVTIINTIKKSRGHSLRNLLNFTNLFLGLLRLQYYSKLFTEEEKSEFINYSLSKGKVERSEIFECWYILPWVYSTEANSDKGDAHPDSRAECDY